MRTEKVILKHLSYDLPFHRTILGTAFYFFTLHLYSQNLSPLSNQRIFTLKTLTDTLATDSLTIIPNSVQLIDLQTNTQLNSIYFIVKNNHILRRKKFLIPNSSFLIKYCVLPFDLSKKQQRLDSMHINPLAPPLAFEYGISNTKNNPIFDKGLEYNGNYTQGLSLGNAQNLVVNQNFNLNLAGQLGDLDILAAMTDNNLPIQAEGNTQELREIDKIFIQLKRKNHTLIAGDYELKRPENSYFTNYFKKLQGVTYLNSSDYNLKKSLTTFQSATLTSKAGIGIAKGKFSRNILPVQEGNQGPYRLLGNESSGYFIILAGTEKVYFDGKLLARGDEYDYVIDYNRGDIQFTPKRLVTKDSRIIVEFEYADQTYLRSTAYISNEFKINKLRLNFNFYSEQDSKNSTGTQALDSLDRANLRKSGNDFSLNPPFPKLLWSSIRPFDDGFKAGRIQYKLLDTLVKNVKYENVLVFSTNLDSAKYTATFTPVGEGKGNYIQATTIANGRVYQWIAPDATGALQGNFEPIKKLTPPNKQQLMTLGTDYQLFKNTKIFTEVALSNNDRNRFSKIGDSTNIGFAFFTHLENKFDFGKKQAWSSQTHIKTEWTQRNFKPLNPYRNAEFTRDWNIPPVSISTQNNATIGNLSQAPSQTSEQFLNGITEIRRKDWFSMVYDVSRYVRTGQYQGLKNTLRSNFQHKGWAVFTEINKLNTEGAYFSKEKMQEKSKFSRPRFDFSKTFSNKLKLGVYAEREKNKRLDTQTDTLTRTSFYYDLWKASIEKTDSSGQLIGFNFLQRFDYQPFTSQFKRISKVNEMNMNGDFSKNEKSQLLWNVTYRNLQVADTTKTTLKPQEIYLGRIEYNFNTLKNAFYGNTLYEIGSGQEQKLEYQYLKVNKGEGQYIWRNRNTDTIPQLDEFENAPFQDQADYVRVTLFSNQFVRTNNIAFSQSLRFDPHTLWGEKQGILKFLSRFSTNSTLQISKKVAPPAPKGGAAASAWNPFVHVIDDRLVAFNISMRNSLFFNRSSPIWDIELGQFDNRNRGLFVTGFEERGRSEWFLRSRWNVSKSISLQNYFAKGGQSSITEGFQNRNYSINLLKTEPELTWMMSNDVRLAFQYKYKNGYNTYKIKGETLKNQDFATEATWNQSVNAQLRAKLSYVKVDFTGEKNTPIEFALLEGLQNGRNFLWNLSLDRVLSKNMFLNINYEGRKTGLVRVVHVGRVAVRASF